jgi:hypothetical protein
MKQSKPEGLAPEEFEKAKEKFITQKGVEYTSVDESKIEKHQSGSDFTGSLIEFDRLYEWKWIDDETKILIEKSSTEPFTGLIHIKDDGLNPDTYPNSQQKIKFAEGVIKFIDSREIT